MNIILEEITEKEFLELHITILFTEERADKSFGIISRGESIYKLAWQSTIVKPVVTHVNDAVFCIGIDLNFAIVDFDEQNILLEKDLDTFFLDTKIFNGFIYVLCQLEIIKIDSITFEITKEYGLPDILEDIIFNKDTLKVICFGGLVIHLE